LLRIAELSRQGAARRVHDRTFDSGDLAALAASGRSPSDLRRRVARLFGEPLDEPVRLSRGGLLILAVLAAVLLTAPIAWQSAADFTAAPTTNTIKGDAGTSDVASAEQFELLVVGPDGKAVPHTAVEIRTNAKLTAEQIQRGQFLKTGPYGTLLKTDAGGRLVVMLPEKPNRFDVSIHQPGFGPYWARWDSGVHPQAIPSRLTAELEAGWSVGGLIVNDDGSPVQGVKVHPVRPRW
jgi:hypothetical protein